MNSTGQHNCRGPDKIIDVRHNAMIHGHIKEYPTELLEELGAIVEQTNIPNASCVVEDRELLTGQDPSSAEALGARFVAKVQAAVGA